MQDQVVCMFWDNNMVLVEVLLVMTSPTPIVRQPSVPRSRLTSLLKIINEILFQSISFTNKMYPNSFTTNKYSFLSFEILYLTENLIDYL